MKSDPRHYVIINFPVGSFVVSKSTTSKESPSCLVSALHELYECSSISRAEYDELLSAYGLNPETTHYFRK
jgi:hypothetical protein